MLEGQVIIRLPKWIEMDNEAIGDRSGKAGL